MAEIEIESRKPKPKKVSKPNQTFQTQVSPTHFTWQTNFGFYSIKIRLDIAEMSVGEKTTKLSPNQTKPT